ncbi:MAG TPA: serine/threonine-protein kinase [Gaiellaceae bacterium]|nr:serine/threonine-protein kinase [Gaiellaceae bacterium]
MTETVLGDRYRLERTLGHGGMSTVHLALDTLLDRTVAVKVLADRFGEDDEVRPRFLREGRLAAKLAHPNVVRVFDSGEEDGRPYIVMELVDGEPLSRELEHRHALPPEEVATLGRQAAAGLAHVHAAGLVHRDVKPQNLVRRDDGLLKLVDFGIARAETGNTITQEGTLLGTAAYMAPELVAGDRATTAVDVYALGAVLYELLTGRPPRQISSLEDLASDEPIPHPAELAPDAPPSLVDAIWACLDRDPARRPSADALAGALVAVGEEHAQATIAAPATTETVVRRPERAARIPPRRGRRLGPILAAVTAAAVLAALGAAMLAGGDGDGATAGGADTPQVQPVPQAETPEEEARNLSDWLRENAR